MRKRVRRVLRGDSQDGASAVEFAIVAPLLFALIFGIIGFGILLAQDLAISNAARQAARTAAVPATGDCFTILEDAERGANGIALANQEAGSSTFEVEVLVTNEPGNADQCDLADQGTPANPNRPCEGSPAGTEVQVTVKYAPSLPLPLIGDITSIQLARQGNYRCEFT